MVRRKSVDAGLYAMNMPEDVGGSDVSFVTWYRAITHVFSKGHGLNQHVLAGPEGPKPLLLLAVDEQRGKYVEPVVEGRKSTAFAQTEPTVGSDSAAMQMTAEKDGDEWELNGTKQWITNADFAQVFARTTPQEEAGRYDGITCFIVVEDEWEFESINNTPAEAGQQTELLFDDVRLPAGRILGSVDNAFYDAMGFLSVGMLELGAQVVGLAEHVLDRAQPVVEDISIFNWFSTQTYWAAADAVVQIHGGNGLSEDYGLMDHLNYVRLLRIVEGTDELQLNTIAKQNGLLD